VRVFDLAFNRGPRFTSWFSYACVVVVMLLVHGWTWQLAYWCAGLTVGVVLERRPWKRGERLWWRLVDGKVCADDCKPLNYSVSTPVYSVEVVRQPRGRDLH